MRKELERILFEAGAEVKWDRDQLRITIKDTIVSWDFGGCNWWEDTSDNYLTKPLLRAIVIFHKKGLIDEYML